MRVTKTTVGEITVLTLVGDVDAGAADTELLAMMPPFAEVLVDLSEVAHVTSAGVRTLLLLYRQGQCLDSTVAIVGMSRELRGVLRAVGFLNFFMVADTVAQGVAMLESSRNAAADATRAAEAGVAGSTPTGSTRERIDA